MGEMQVPNDKLYGCQTARSMKNFPIGGEADKMPRQIIQVTRFILLK
jgi:fumarate hydratase class II